MATSTIIILAFSIALPIAGGFIVWLVWSYNTAHNGHTPLSHMMYDEEVNFTKLFDWIPDSCEDFGDFIIRPAIDWFLERLTIIGKIFIIPVWLVVLAGFIVEYIVSIAIQVPIITIIFILKGILKLFGLIFLKKCE